MEIQSSFASQLYDTARKLSSEAPAQDGPVAGQSFAETFAEAGRDILGTLRTGETAATAAVSGQGDLQSVVEALSQAEIALQTAVSVRDRVVEAYQQVLRMPV